MKDESAVDGGPTGSAPTSRLEVRHEFSVPGSWRFTPQVAASFDDHVKSSVPFYDEIQQLVASLADWLAPNGAIVADLGASTGTTAAVIAQRHPERQFHFWLYDEQESMLNFAREKLAGINGTCEYRVGRIEQDLAHEDAHLTLALFTLQFLDPRDRVSVLRDVRKRTRPGGALLFAEKLRLTDAQWQEIAISSSHDYKAACGISDAEIRSKEQALRGVLNPLTDEGQRSMLADCGWRNIETIFRWHQWVLYGALA